MADKLINTEAFLKKYGKEVESEIKNRLLTYGKKASGKLYKSIRFEVKESIKSLDAVFRMEDYGLFVDGGVKGAGIPSGFQGKKKPVVTTGKFKFGQKMPPDNNTFKKWMKLKGIPKDKSFAVRRSIWIFGIAPTNFFTIPIKRREKQLATGIEKAMGKDFELIVSKSIK